jgi:signal transduction histidine kinase
VSYLYRQEGIELREELEPGLPMILGNLGKLQQVLMNLFSNAKDAMESSEEKVILVSTRRDTDQEAGRIVIEVSDTGCGIDPEQLQRVFTRGYTTKPIGKGSGMGLDLVRRIVQEMGGSITVDSEPGAGACFTLTFSPMD